MSLVQSLDLAAYLQKTQKTGKQAEQHSEDVISKIQKLHKLNDQFSQQINYKENKEIQGESED